MSTHRHPTKQWRHEDEFSSKSSGNTLTSGMVKQGLGKFILPLKQQVYWNGDRHRDQGSRTENPEKCPHMVNWLNKGVDTIQCGNNSFFFQGNVTGISKYSHAKEWIWTPISHQQKLTKNES